MNLSEKDYRKLYKIQDTFLNWWSTLQTPFYLTGGTALGRFFIHHRYSEDLDFFVNAHPDFMKIMESLRKPLVDRFSIAIADTLITDDFARFFITLDDQKLKIDFVNDVAQYSGDPIKFRYGLIDNPLNILTNKLGAIIGRDEPKDYFDILHLAMHYSFNWTEVFLLAKDKMFINELDVCERLSNFPVDSFKFVDWLMNPIQTDLLMKNMVILSDDFLLGKANSLGSTKPPIKQIKDV